MKQTDNPPGATKLSDEELLGLKIKTITTRGELDRWEQDNINDAMSWLEKRRNKTDILNEEFVCKLHKKMFEKIWTWAGSFRRSDKNIGVDWQMVGISLRSLLDDVKYWIENRTYEYDEIATRFHHRLVAIHPFPNGNGRHTRLIADVLLMDVFDLDTFSWGNDNLVTAGDVRTRYIAALKSADGHDYKPLLEFVRS